MVLAILQARTSSSRLYGKVLQPVLGRSMILRELERLERSKEITKLILATSVDESDDELALTVETEGYVVYRGSLDDVLARYYTCAKEYEPEHVVRLTGDCPVIDWRLVDEVIRRHIAEKNDYTRTTDRFPDGLDTEVMTFAALEQAHRKASLVSEREHVTLYIRKHPELFRLGEVDAQEDWSAMRWTVDEPRDLALIKHVFSLLYPTQPDFCMYDILALLKEHAELLSCNAGILRNEGLIKSLHTDKVYRKNECAH